MKTLILMRHAKAETQNFDKSDLSRNLTTRGNNDAGLISSVFLLNNDSPDAILSSPSNRTMQTASIFASNANINPGLIHIENTLYEGVSTYELLELLNKCCDKSRNILVCGHNPWISYVSSNLAENFNDILPTSGIVVLQFDVNYWNEIEKYSGKLLYFDYPKKHKA